jgi:hypothetical protein
MNVFEFRTIVAGVKEWGESPLSLGLTEFRNGSQRGVLRTPD